MAQNRVIGLAVDNSEYSEHALVWLNDKIIKPDDTVVIINVTEQPSFPTLTLKSGFAVPTAEWGEIMKKKLEDTEKLKYHYKINVHVGGDKIKFIQVPNMDPGPGIISAAKENNVDLIIIGTRGQNKVRRTILGSVSDYVLHHSHIPVAVVPLTG